MWFRPRPPSLVSDWIFLYVMGGPGSILSEGVRLESGFWETIQGGCGPQNSVIASESVLALDSASGGNMLCYLLQSKPHLWGSAGAW